MTAPRQARPIGFGIRKPTRRRLRWVGVAVLVIVAWQVFLETRSLRLNPQQHSFDLSGLNFVESTSFTSDFDADGLPDLLYSYTADRGYSLRGLFMPGEPFRPRGTGRVQLISSRSGESLDSWESVRKGKQYSITWGGGPGCVHSSVPGNRSGSTCELQQCEPLMYEDHLLTRLPFEVGGEQYFIEERYEDDYWSPTWVILKGEKERLSWTRERKEDDWEHREEWFAPMDVLKLGLAYEMSWRSHGLAIVEFQEHRFTENGAPNKMTFDARPLLSEGMSFEAVAWSGVEAGQPVLLLRYSGDGVHSWVEYRPHDPAAARLVETLPFMKILNTSETHFPLVTRLGENYVFSHVSIRKGGEFPLQIYTKIPDQNPSFHELGVSVKRDGIEETLDAMSKSWCGSWFFGVTEQDVKSISDQDGDGVDDWLHCYSVDLNRSRLGVVLVSGATGKVVPR